MNKQLRKSFPKNKSIDHLTAEDIFTVNNMIISQKVTSFSYKTNEVIESIYGSKLFISVTKN